MKKNKKHILLFSITFSFFLFAVSTYAQTPTPLGYVPLASIPSPSGTGNVGSTDLATYFSQMYQLGVGIATALAVLMVIWGGVEYITTDAIGGKEEGKEKVQNAILGLLLALGSYLILQTINPAFLNTNLGITPITTTGAKAPTVSSATGGNLNAWLQSNWNSTDQENYDAALRAKSNGWVLSDPQQAALDKFNNNQNLQYQTNAWTNWTSTDKENYDAALRAKSNGWVLSDPQQAALDKASINQTMQEQMNKDLSSGANTVSSDASSKIIASNSSQTSDTGWSMSQRAESSLGMSTNIGSQTDYGNLGCAYAVGQIITNALGENISTSLSTTQLNTDLSNSDKFTLVPGGLSNAAPGDVVVSPTSNGSTGHTGIIGSNGTIISNSSSKGSVQDNYTSTTWNNYYGGKGLQTYVYRPK